MDTITLNKPDDWHVHLRDGAYLSTTTQHIAQRFARACIMPNLVPPVTTVAQATTYREQILSQLPPDHDFQPMMSLYLTDTTNTDTVKHASENETILAFKLYPAGATTHSNAGVSKITSLYPVFEQMQKNNIPLQIHGEVTDPNVDIFDREAVFIEHILAPLVNEFPTLKIVLEHISTREAIKFIEQANENIAATITAHHLLLNRNDVLVGGIKPHHYCLPILKTKNDQNALLDAALSGNPKFFFGSDSAPHRQSKKESACGCAGIYTAHASLELITQLFSQHQQLEKLSGFMSQFGADFYGLPRNQDTITLVKKTWEIPAYYHYGDEQLIPLFTGKKIQWQIKK